MPPSIQSSRSPTQSPEACLERVLRDESSRVSRYKPPTPTHTKAGVKSVAVEGVDEHQARLEPHGLFPQPPQSFLQDPGVESRPLVHQEPQISPVTCLWNGVEGIPAAPSQERSWEHLGLFEGTEWLRLAWALTRRANPQVKY